MGLAMRARYSTAPHVAHVSHSDSKDSSPTLSPPNQVQVSEVLDGSVSAQLEEVNGRESTDRDWTIIQRNKN